MSTCGFKVYVGAVKRIQIPGTWIPVERDELIEFNLESSPLELQTDSELGSEDRTDVTFFDSDINLAGGLILSFYSPLRYRISDCMSYYAEFDTTPPSDKDKVWRVTIDRERSYLVNLLIHCDNQLVLERGISSSKCDSRYNNTVWGREIYQISFTSTDTASDAYRPYKPGKL